MDDTGKVLTLNKIKFNKTITFHCHIGYNLTSGTSKRRCHDIGTWSGTKPKCSPITCTKPKETPCGYYSSNITTSEVPAVEFSYNTTLLFVCNNSKYSCLNKTQDIRCSENGVWSDNKHLCGVLKDIKQEQTGENDAENTNSDALIGAICGVVFIIGSGVFVTFIILKRRNIFRRKKSDDERQSFRSSLTHATDLEIFIDGQETNIVTERTQIGMADTSRNTNRVYINTTVGDSGNQTYYDFRNSESLPKTAIKIDDLQDVVFNGNNGNKIFETQFKALPQGMVENFSEAVKLENKGKNRYTRLYAYDDTRVVLNTDEDSSTDYINACYVHGFNKSRKYIATQGPTKNTVADFWWMVWQEDTSKIVMLTNLIEEGKNKCIKYWPDDMEESFGSLKICLKKVETHSQFDIRTLSVKKVMSSYNNNLNSLFNNIECLERIPAEKMVTQFHFTVWPDKGIPRYASALVHFLKKVNNAPTHGSGPIIVHCSAGVGRTGTYIALDYLTDQGKTLGYVDVAGCVDSLRRQRVSLVQTLITRLPMCLEDFMPFVTRDDGKPVYINAVFLPSYNEKNAFIITQSPLKSTREEFWMLAWEQEVHTIVMLNSTDEIENDEKYWPEGKTTVFGNIHVSKESTDTASNHIVLTLSLKKNDTTRRIKQIRCGGWRKGNVLPDSPDTILSLLETVRAWQQQTGNHKILVHCMNGADRSGLFCVISSVIERMKIEQDVAIASVVEEMRNAREQIIPCLEQYQFCHEVVLNFIQQYDTYSNFRS
ncbi:receptor-type tyrosine-protein phosphatase alpha-like [Ruditapes philippinarum]|uniref:receptor-type tyrosine-protein phosphatase alpha-like n=1 Tax=Ruditapes philippinarum TaxID=129788 RepID=UPI00295B5F92|nr:receptor-type tyrosine-protein phosphatase alpha-like [Ruditapes philippinarum]